MMIAPAGKLGIEIKVLAETQDSPAAEATTLVGDFTDLETVLNFAQSVDVISSIMSMCRLESCSN